MAVYFNAEVYILWSNTIKHHSSVTQYNRMTKVIVNQDISTFFLCCNDI